MIATVHKRGLSNELDQWYPATFPVLDPVRASARLGLGTHGGEDARHPFTMILDNNRRNYNNLSTFILC